jgi:hypothetical protein
MGNWLRAAVGVSVDVPERVEFGNDFTRYGTMISAMESGVGICCALALSTLHWDRVEASEARFL